MARAMQLIGFAAVASADMGPSARQLRGYSANSTSKLSANAAGHQGLGQPCRWGNEGIEYGYCADGLQCYRPTTSMFAPEGAGMCIKECSSWGSTCSMDSPTYGTTCECLGSGGKMFCGNPAVRWETAQKCFWPISYLPMQCESLSQTDAVRCPRVQGGSGAYINTDKTCVYNPGCINGAVSQNCFEQTGCQYKP